MYNWVLFQKNHSLIVNGMIDSILFEVSDKNFQEIFNLFQSLINPEHVESLKSQLKQVCYFNFYMNIFSYIYTKHLCVLMFKGKISFDFQIQTGCIRMVCL